MATITVNDVKRFTDTLKKDTLIDVEVEVYEDIYESRKAVKRLLKAVVLEIYPHVTKTSRGVFRNEDLYAWNREGVWR